MYTATTLKERRHNQSIIDEYKNENGIMVVGDNNLPDLKWFTDGVGSVQPDSTRKALHGKALELCESDLVSLLLRQPTTTAKLFIL